LPALPRQPPCVATCIIAHTVLMLRQLLCSVEHLLKLRARMHYISSMNASLIPATGRLWLSLDGRAQTSYAAQSELLRIGPECVSVTNAPVLNQYDHN
jgi:hypothetical protein